MLQLFIIRGLPGSGKSTLAEHLAFIINEGNGHGYVFSNDQYFENLAQLNNTSYSQEWRGSLVKFAIQDCIERTREALEIGKRLDNNTSIFVANTFTKESYLKPYLELGKEFDAKITVLTVENYHGGENVHNVPDETIDNMEKKFSVKLR